LTVAVWESAGSANSMPRTEIINTYKTFRFIEASGAGPQKAHP
jgi:hypothetical protein